MSRILIIESQEIGEILAYTLQEEGFITVLIHDVIPINEVIAMMPDVIIVHEHVSNLRSGSQFIRDVHNNLLTNNVKTVLISTHPDIALIAKECGADAYIEKPFDLDHIPKVIKRLLR